MPTVNTALHEDVDMPSVFEPISLGQYEDGDTCEYSLHKTSNFHILVVGRTGSGKTYIILKLIPEYWKRNVTIFAIDTQGDLNNVHLPGSAFNNIEFSYESNIGTINPLIINTHEGGGGLYIAIAQVIECIRVFYPDLGSRQEEEFIQLLVEFYASHNIHIENRNSWNEPCPVWADLQVYIEEQIKNPKASFKVSKLENMKSRIDRMAAVGLFGEDTLADCIQAGKINRFSLVSLYPTHQQVMIRLLLERIFSRAVRGCKQLNPDRPDMLLVLDEGKHAAFTAKNPMSALNRIATEGRKFGLGMLLGVQGLSQLPEDVVSSPAINIVTPIHVTQYPAAVNKLSIKKVLLRDLKPRAQALVMIDEGDFRTVNIR